MATIDWTKFTRRIYIACETEQVYNAWTIPQHIEEWFLESAEYKHEDGSSSDQEDHYKAGDTFTWKWHNWEHLEKGKVLEANGKDFVKFTFADGTVSVKLREVDGRTEMTLIQEEIKEDEESRYKIFHGCSLGWSFWMVNLKAWLEHGITLNETKRAGHEGMELVNS